MSARDPGLEAYVQAIERQLSRQRGRELSLSPPDFQLARGWFRGGLPLAAVLAGIDSAGSGARLPSTLKACRRAVERLAGATTAPPGADAPVSEEPTEAGALSALAERLAQLSARSAAFVEVAREAPALGTASAAGIAAWRARVGQASVAALSVDERDALLGSARRALERQGNLNARERAAALERHLLRRALERFGLVDLL